MAFSFGSGVNAGLGRADFSEIAQAGRATAQGIASAGAIKGQSIANLGQGIANSIQQYQTKKLQSDQYKSIAKSIASNEGLAKQFGIKKDDDGTYDEAGIYSSIKTLGTPEAVGKFVLDAGMGLQRKEEEATALRVQEERNATAQRIKADQDAASASALGKFMQDMQNGGRVEQSLVGIMNEGDRKIAQQVYQSSQSQPSAETRAAQLAKTNAEIDKLNAEATDRRAMEGERERVRNESSLADKQKADQERLINEQSAISLHQKREIAASAVREQIDLVQKNIDRSITMLALDAGGTEAIVSQYIPTSDAATLNTFYKQITSNTALESLAELKNLSPTGASGLGPTNQTEIDMLRDKFGLLKVSNDPNVQRMILKDIQESFQGIRSRVDASFDVKYDEAGNSFIKGPDGKPILYQKAQ